MNCKIFELKLPVDHFYDTFITQINKMNDGDTVFRLSLIVSKDENLKKKKYEKKLIFGVSSRNCKIFCKPMIEILHRLCACLFLDIMIIPDEVVRNYDIHDWPIVDILLCFYAQGYPLDKAISYANLRNPFLINDLEKQKLLLDRKAVYDVLTQIGISVPNFVIVERDPDTLQTVHDEVVEEDDAIYYNGKKMAKPFVEKPLDAENHNINIYFPPSIGGGVQKLFRKMGNRSSFYCKYSTIRRNRSYVYEEFMSTDGADVKIYCVGPEYAHAEARKSPALDGKVERDYTNKEMRYPVILSSIEKLAAKKVVEVFQQNMCGLDMLRTGGKYYICDVNGFSFVKKSTKYYDDCAHMLVDLLIRRFGYVYSCPDILTKINSIDKLNAKFNLNNEKNLELVSVIGIFRHGDRTPKQKMKMLTKHDSFLKLFKKYGGERKGRIKLKKPHELQDVLDTTNHLIKTNTNSNILEAIDNPAKLYQMKYVLEMYGQFMGFNRKVQIKSLHDERNKILERKFRERHPKHKNTIDFSDKMLLLILKWGGELTEVGRVEAEELGKWFTNRYPQQKRNSTIPTVYSNSKLFKGLLRLHSTYRHNMKVFASDEGRVQLTAAAFARSMLSLESNLAPILVHMVQCSDKTTRMLDSSNQVEFRILNVKRNLQEKLSTNRDIDDEYINTLTNPSQEFLKDQLRKIKNPYEACNKIHELIKKVHREITAFFHFDSYLSYLSPDSLLKCQDFVLCHGESPELMIRRWSKLDKDFKMANGKYDMSLIPDIYDCSRYDYFHNSFLNIESLRELYENAKVFAHVVIAQEYGISVEEKLSIGRDVCDKLLNKISTDLQHDPNAFEEEGHVLDANGGANVTSPYRRVRTRLYFTSESHMYCLMNIIRYGGLFSDEFMLRRENRNLIDDTPEYDFLSNIIIMQYEDPSVDKNDENRFLVEIFFSSGNNRTQPITKKGQLARPNINTKNRKHTNKSSTSELINVIKDDISLEQCHSDNENNGGSRNKLNKLTSGQGNKEFENAAYSFCDLSNFQKTLSYPDAKYQLRKPNTTSQFIVTRKIPVISGISDLHAVAPIVSRNLVVKFIDDFIANVQLPDNSL